MQTNTIGDLITTLCLARNNIIDIDQGRTSHDRIRIQAQIDVLGCFNPRKVAGKKLVARLAALYNGYLPPEHMI